MKHSFAFACSLAAILASSPLSADPLTTDYTTNVTMGTSPSSTDYISGYAVSNYSLTGTDTLNFSDYDSVSFLLSSGGDGYFTYDASTTDSYWSFSLTFGTSSAGMVPPANFAITFLDESGNAVGVTYDSLSLVMGSNASYPDGLCLNAEFYNISQSFTFSSIRIDMDYSGYSEAICAEDISLSTGSMQCWTAAESYTSVLTYTAVPEPATYAGILGTVSLGIAGLVRRRKRK